MQCNSALFEASWLLGKAEHDYCAEATLWKASALTQERSMWEHKTEAIVIFEEVAALYSQIQCLGFLHLCLYERFIPVQKIWFWRK